MYGKTNEVVYIPGNHPETMLVIGRREWEEKLRELGYSRALEYFRKEDHAGKAELEYFRKL